MSVVRRFLPFLSLAAVSWLATPSFAQYMFLDANGDGANTAADVIATSGTTTLDIWLRTDTNRDGAAAVCSSGEALTINSYEFILRVSNGKITWGAYTNNQPDMSTSFGLASSATEYHNGFGGGAIFPPGTYKLGTLSATPALGSPSISIAATTPLSGGYLTSFGSQCQGQDFDNTLKLGTDWFDVDGLPYGGTAQAPPVLNAIADMTVDEDATATQTITGTDADHQPLEFSKVSGPTYMTVTTTDPGSGTATGAITLTPGVVSGATATGVVAVSDGITTDQRSFGITVLHHNHAPTLSTLPPVTLIQGVQYQGSVGALDADGDHILITMVGAPSYVVPYLFGPTEGDRTASGQFFANPTACDVGPNVISFEATDGQLIGRTHVNVTVFGTPPAPPPPADLFTSVYTVTEVSGRPSGVGVGDFDGDGDADAAIAIAAAGLVEIYASDRRGGLDLTEQIQAGAPIAIAAADLDHDGVGDVLYVDETSGELVVMKGPFAGSTQAAQRFPLGPRPAELEVGDLNHDGWTDAFVVIRGAAALAIFMNDGAGALSAPTLKATSPDPVALTLGDFNGDARTDVAVVCQSPRCFNTFLGLSDGTLSAPVTQDITSYPPTSRPTGLATFRVNNDALDDLALGTHDGGAQFYFSNGDGTFPSYGLTYFGRSEAVTSHDIDGDGRLDLFAGVHATQGTFVTDHLGYLAIYGTNQPFSYYPMPGGPVAGMGFGDVDGDGSQDVIAVHAWGPAGYVTMTGVACVFRNQGDGSLGSTRAISQSGGYRGTPLLDDFNRDGHLDLVLPNVTYLGVGDGTLKPPIPWPGYAGLGSVSASADLNGDGNLDIVSAPRCCYTLNIAVGIGDGTFVPGPQPTLTSSRDQYRTLALVDVDGDGPVDLIVSGGSGFVHEYEIWHGRGDGTFEDPTRTPQSLGEFKMFDYDHDGHLDITFPRDRAIAAMRARGDGTYEDPVEILTLPSSGYAFDFGDLNGDGLLDMVVGATSSGTPLRAALQQGDHTFDLARPFWTMSAGARTEQTRFPTFDMDGDGDADIVAGFLEGLALGFGNGSTMFSKRRIIGPAGGYMRVGDLNEDGWLDIVTAGDDPQYPGEYSNPIIIHLNNSERLNRRAARAFTASNKKLILVGAAGRDVCLRVEPVGGSYVNADLDLATVVMKSKGTGSVDQITSIPSKTLVEGDADGNGINEIGVCFKAADAARLFSLLNGRKDVLVSIEGRLGTSQFRMYAEVTLTVVRTGSLSAAAPTLGPNPLNPTGVFRFATQRPGAARIQLFDVQGRLVRTVLDRALPAGEQEVHFDGKDRDGRALASGVYFARVETVEGRYRMRVAIVK